MQVPAFDLDRSAYFDDLADNWDRLGNQPDEDKVRRFLDGLGIEPGQTVMDLGSGTGFLVPFIFAYEPGTVIAVDLSAKMLAKIAEKYSRVYGDRLRLLHADVHDLGLDDRSVDVVVCNGAFPHFHHRALALAQIFRILRAGGVFAINHFIGKEAVNAIHGGSANVHIRQDLLEPAADLAGQLAAAGFRVREARDREAEYCLIAVRP